MSKRPSLRTAMPSPADEAAEAAAIAARMNPAPSKTKPDEPMTTTTIHLPVALLRALRNAAERRSAGRMEADPKGRGGRPSVSEVVVELLTKHRSELEEFE